MIARRLGDHPDLFFAPIAAVVALNASWGERGSNAVREAVKQPIMTAAHDDPSNDSDCQPGNQKYRQYERAQT